MDEEKEHYPDFQWMNDKGIKVDLVLISHFHLDHIGALPRFTEIFGYEGDVYASEPTKSVAPMLLRDYAGLRRRGTKNATVFSETQMNRCVEKIKTLNLQEPIVVDGMEIKAYYAGHVLGAVMFHVKYQGQSVMYSGDYNMTADRHLGAAKIDRPLWPDVVITECTYALTNHNPKLTRERDFLRLVHSHVTVTKGRVLIPVFTLGAVQEMSMLLEQHWERTKCKVPIYFAQGMMEKAQAYYRSFAKWGPSEADEESVFTFRHIRPMSDTMRREFLRHDDNDENVSTEDVEPCIVFASPGMLAGGLSLQIFRKWHKFESTLVLIPGYCSGGTTGYRLQEAYQAAKRTKNSTASSERKKRKRDEDSGFMLKDRGLDLQVRCEVKSMSFASHVDSLGIMRFLRQCQPRHVVLVHSEASKMVRFKNKLATHIPGLPVYDPANKTMTRISTSITTTGKTKSNSDSKILKSLTDRWCDMITKRCEGVDSSSFLEGTDGCPGCTW